MESVKEPRDQFIGLTISPPIEKIAQTNTLSEPSRVIRAGIGRSYPAPDHHYGCVTVGGSGAADTQRASKTGPNSADA